MKKDGPIIKLISVLAFICFYFSGLVFINKVDPSGNLMIGLILLYVASRLGK